jgi:hypothetical protein
MNESALKKEFRKSDVQRIRNLVNKDFTSSTKSQTGYKKSTQRHKEGDIWEESGKTWTIKNGLKQNVTKLDAAKKAAQVPLKCPKCSGSMSYYLSKKIYKINKMCFNCFIEYEAELRRNGLYEDYLIHARKGNLKFFIEELEQRLQEALNYEDSFVTEQGDVESWNSNNSKIKQQMTEKFQEYITYLKSKLD